MVPKSGSPVIGQTEVNSGLTCVMVNRRPSRGFGKVSSSILAKYGANKEQRIANKIYSLSAVLCLYDRVGYSTGMIIGIITIERSVSPISAS